MLLVLLLLSLPADIVVADIVVADVSTVTVGLKAATTADMNDTFTA